MEIIPPTTETIITTVIRKTMEIFTKRMILMRVIRNTNQGGENRVMNESLCFVRRKTLYPHRASLCPVAYMNRNWQKVWKASWNVLARIFPRCCHFSFQFLNLRKQSEWQKVVFLIFPPRLSRPYLGCQLRVISSSYKKTNIMSSFSHLTLPEDYFAKPYQIL